MSTVIFDRNIPPKFLRYIKNRDNYIVDICKSKNVLHVGACDYPFTKERWEKGDLLYKRISNVCNKQLGVDLIEEATEFLNSKKITNSKIIVHNMNQVVNLSFIPDVIIFGETLEHLMNLETAIQNLKKIMAHNTILLISVPNAFYFMNFLFALFRKEHQHPDHSVAFTYKTLTKLMNKNNLKVHEFHFTSLEISLDKNIMNVKGKLMTYIVRIMSMISPVFAETLMITVKK